MACWRKPKDTRNERTGRTPGKHVMRIPLFPLDVVLFPGAALPLHIFEERYKEMIAECMARHTPFGVVRAGRDGMSVVGCTAEIVSVMRRYPDGRSDILCRGVDRFEIESLHDSRSFLEAEVDLLPDEGPEASRELRKQCAGLHIEMVALSEDDEAQFAAGLDLNQPVAYLLAASIPAGLSFRQELLHQRSDAQRTQMLIDFYQSILPKLRLGAVGKLPLRNSHVM
jgi:Lon protease-like protein